MVASLTNSIASAFWMAYHVLSDSADEVENLVQVDDNDIYVIDLAKVKSSCPFLLSTWQKTLRYVHIGISARGMMEDTMFDNK